MSVSISEIFAELGFNDKLYEFYQGAICTLEYKYVIIVPRKCMTEYKCLCKEHKDLVFQHDGVYYMTSKSFIQYKRQMINDFSADEGEWPSILIIDDIMMHGRGINQLLKNLVKNVPAEIEPRMIDHIYIDVFIESNKEFLIDEKFQPIIDERFNCFYSYNKFENVLKASDLFLESFYAKSVPNTSFVNAWYYKDSQTGHRAKKILDEKAKNDMGQLNETDCLYVYKIQEKPEQLKYGFHSLVYYEKLEPWMENIAEFCCVRAYYNEIENNIFFVPFVFLKPMSGGQIDHLLKLFQKELSLPQIWADCEADNDMYIFKYEYLMKLISDCYGIIFMSRYLPDEWQKMTNWNDIYREDEIVTEFTFGMNNVLSMNDLCYRLKESSITNIKNICQDNQPNSFIAFKEESDSIQLLEEAFKQEVVSLAEILNSFLKYSNLKDEELAAAKKERYFGLSTLSIKNIFERKEYLKANKRGDLYGEIVRCMDAGTASISIKKMSYNENTYYGAVLNSGEQAYRELQGQNKVPIHYMALIEQDCLNLLIGDFTERIIDNFWEEVKNNLNFNASIFKGIKEVRNTVKRRNGRYSELDVKRSIEGAEELDQICQDIYKKITY